MTNSKIIDFIILYISVLLVAHFIGAYIMLDFDILNWGLFNTIPGRVISLLILCMIALIAAFLQTFIEDKRSE